MDSLSSEGSLVSIRICLVIGLRLRLRLRLADWLACVRNSGEFVRFDRYTIYDYSPVRTGEGNLGRHSEEGNEGSSL